MDQNNDRVAIIGAGPYGLAAAAYLRAAGFQTVVFGRTMDFWKEQMPQGMCLRSSWDASHIADPLRVWTLDAYQKSEKPNLSSPIPLDDFVNYGEWFQKLTVPDLDERRVRKILPAAGGFQLILEDGDILPAKRVVIAAGIAPFAYRPPLFSHLPASLISHTADHCDLAIFAGKRIVVIGSGQSAIETAAIANQLGAEVEVIARAPDIRWLSRSGFLHTQTPKYLRRLLYPPSDVGPPGLNQIVSRPGLFRKMPFKMQSWVAYRSIRPAAAGWLRSRLDGVKMTFGRQVQSAEQKQLAAVLTLDDGEVRIVDHVLLATGYQVDFRKYPFLTEEITNALRQQYGYPVLMAGMESSMPGLHFLGAPSAMSFGPLMRFVSGTGFAARQLTCRLLLNGGSHA